MPKWQQPGFEIVALPSAMPASEAIHTLRSLGFDAVSSLARCIEMADARRRAFAENRTVNAIQQSKVR